MTYTVKDAMKLDSLSKANCIAGKKGLYNKVEDIIIMEAHDIEKWLIPNQLILSSLYSLKDSSYQEYIEFIAKVKKHGGSGIIVKVGRFVDTIPAGLIQGCNQFDIPLILIDQKTAYKDIVLQVMQNMLNQKAAMLDVYQNIHNIFKELSMQQPKLRDIANTLMSIIKRDVEITDEDNKVLVTTQSKVDESNFVNKRELYRDPFMHYKYTRELFQVDDLMYSKLVCEIPDITGMKRYLKVYEMDTFIEMVDYMAIENAASIIQLERSKELALSKVKQTHYNDLVDHLINGKYKNNDELYECVKNLGLVIHKSYRVVTWRIDRYKSIKNLDSIDTYEKQISENTSIVSVLRQMWPDIAYRVYADRITFIAVDDSKTSEEFKTKVSQYIQDSLEKTGIHNVRLKISISDKGKLENIKSLARQALKIMQLGEILGKASYVSFYDDLGVYKMLLEVSSDSNLSDFIPKVIFELNDYDPSFLYTLKVYLDNKQNLKDTSEVLYVHPKTVRYRIDKIVELTNIDLNDSEYLLNLQIGMRIYELVNTPVL